MSNLLFLSVNCNPFPVINHRNRVMVVGSCFAEHIGQKLDAYKFGVIQNPWGIAYNPISIAKNIRRAINNELFQKTELFEFNELYQSWNHHGVFSDTNAEMALHKMNLPHEDAAHFFNQEQGILSITFGSAWVYELEGEIVANCHKFPSSNFNKRLLEVDEIVEEYSLLISQIPSGHKIIFTVSPVRYIRDGLRENLLSKSILHLAIEQLKNKFSNVYYFPSYEIMMDELRDYRFYKDDLVHPNELAINIIWDRFKSTFIDTESRTIIDRWHSILGDLNHRILFPNTTSAKKFILKLEKKLLDFADQTGIGVDRELNNLTIHK